MSGRVYRCAVIGCGQVGSGYDPGPRRGWGLSHAGAYRACSRTRLAAAADVDRGRLAAFGRKWAVERLHSDYRALLAEEDIDILSVCLPAAEQPRVFEAACRAGVKAFFLEKPLAADLAAAGRVARLARGRVVAVNYFRRWNLSLRGLREEFRSGRHGAPLHAVLRYTKGVCGNGSHLVDLARWWWGEPAEVRTVRRHAGSGEDPGVDFGLRFAGGWWAHFLHVPSAPYVFIDADILTEKGRVVVSQRGQRIRRFGLAREPHYGSFEILRDVSDRETLWRRCLVSAVSELARCLDRGGRPSCTVEDALAALRICRRAALH